MPPTSSFRLLFFAVCGTIAFAAFAVEADEGLFLPNWDRELALQTARYGTDEHQLQDWFALLRNRETATLYRSLQNFSSAGVIPSPARERQLYLFTQALSDFPAETIPEEILGFLERYPAKTLVPHEEHAGSGVALFNIAAAARGVRNAGFRDAGSLASDTLIRQPAQWAEAYLSGDAATRRGFLDSLDAAGTPELQGIGITAFKLLPLQTALTGVAGAAALRLNDLPALETLTIQGRGAELAGVLRQAARQLPEAGRGNLLLSAIDQAPAENAALAIAVLAPGLRGDETVTRTLFALLGHAELGSAAALALVRQADPEVDAELRRLAAGEGEPARRAKMALEMGRALVPAGAAPGAGQ